MTGSLVPPAAPPTARCFSAPTGSAARFGAREQQAKAFCVACPGQAECLGHALAAGEHYGIGAGRPNTNDATWASRRTKRRETTDPRGVGGVAGLCGDLSAAVLGARGQVRPGSGFLRGL